MWHFSCIHTARFPYGATEQGCWLVTDLLIDRSWDAERGRELKHLAQADREIAEINKRIARQRRIQPSLEDASFLQALEASRRAFEKHRELVLDLLANGGRPLLDNQ
jgi:hypothetical protein